MNNVENAALSRFEEALSLYDLNLTNESVAAETRALLDANKAKYDTREARLDCLHGVELTTLKPTDSYESVLALTEKVNKFFGEHPELSHVGTICVYPRFAKTVAESLEIDQTKVVCVVGAFPATQTFLEVKTVETALTVKDGAEEVDMVLSVGQFLQGDYETCIDEIQEIKAAAGDAPLKVILETGCLETALNIKKASILSIYAGADFIKTSTGKEKVAATPEAAYVMCKTIREYYDKTGIKIGFKPAGGVNTVSDALDYYTIVREILGEEWIKEGLFRIGTSRMTNLLVSELVGKDIKPF